MKVKISFLALVLSIFTIDMNLEKEKFIKKSYLTHD